MSEHAINGFVGVSMEKIRSMVDANTMVGEPIQCGDGVIVIPVSKIAVGFASGGSDLPTRTSKEYFAGGAGAGMSVKPVGFLVVQNDTVRMIPITESSGLGGSIVEMIPTVMDKVSSFLKKETDDSGKTENSEKTESGFRNPFRRSGKKTEAAAEPETVAEIPETAE